MLTESGNLHLTLPALAALGASVDQTDEPVGEGFAALFEAPPEAGGEVAAMQMVDAPPGGATFWVMATPLSVQVLAILPSPQDHTRVQLGPEVQAAEPPAEPLDLTVQPPLSMLPDSLPTDQPGTGSGLPVPVPESDAGKDFSSATRRGVQFDGSAKINPESGLAEVHPGLKAAEGPPLPVPHLSGSDLQRVAIVSDASAEATEIANVAGRTPMRLAHGMADPGFRAIAPPQRDAATGVKAEPYSHPSQSVTTVPDTRSEGASERTGPAIIPAGPARPEVLAGARAQTVPAGSEWPMNAPAPAGFAPPPDLGVQTMGDRPPLSTGRTIAPAPDQGADATGEAQPAKDGISPAPETGLQATEAERMWLGRHLGQETPEAGHGSTEPGNTRPVTDARGAVPQGRAERPPTQTEPKVYAKSDVEIHISTLTDAVPGPRMELSLSPMSPTGQPGPLSSPATAPLTATSVPHLAAGIASTLHHGADGTTEIALSPEELGGVRLRLEADAQDPDRVVIHLAFDRPETMDLFRRHADQLAEAIRAAGYAEARLDFGQTGTGPEAGQGRGSSEDQGNPASKLANAATDPGMAPDTPTTLRPTGTAGLDLRL